MVLVLDVSFQTAESTKCGATELSICSTSFLAFEELTLVDPRLRDAPLSSHDGNDRGRKEGVSVSKCRAALLSRRKQRAKD